MWEADDLDEQRRRGVDRQPGMDVGLDGSEAQLVHHLDGGRHDAGGDDVAHRPGTVLDAREVHQQRLHGGRVRRELHAHLGGDAEHALAADEHSAQVVPIRLRVLTAEHRDGSVRQDDLHRQHVRRRDPFGETVRSARVVGHVAADGTRLLAARVGREVEAVGVDVA